MGDGKALPRRAALAGVAGLGASTIATTTASAAEAAPAQLPQSGEQVRELFRVVDKRGRQAVRIDTRKPPAIIGGKEIPADQRQGPDPATYLIFNCENGDERGGIVASENATQLSMDYPNTQAIALTALTDPGTKASSAGLSLATPADPAAPPGQTGPVERAQLVCTTDQGTLLVLRDSHRRPRIVLEVGADDVPRIRVLAADGEVVHELS